ncbi:MAG: CsbD family protein [Candidatus Acidiferrales bacterium]
MNWNWVEGSLKLYKGKIKESWGRLTEDELYVINGKREQFAGRLQKSRTFDDMSEGAQSSRRSSVR